MLNLFEKLRSLAQPKSFGRNLLMVSSGAAINLAATLVFTPIIARLYSQEDYGMAALYYSTIFLGGSLIGLAFPSAIVIPKEEEDSNRLVELCIMLATWGVVILSLVILVLWYFNVLDLPWWWLFLVPPGVWLVSLDATLSNQTVRHKMFKKVSVSVAASGLVSKVTSVLYALVLKASTVGLMISNVLLLLVSNGLKLNEKLRGIRVSLFDFGKHKRTFMKFVDYPLYIFPGSLMSRVSKDVPVYLFAFVYDFAFLGSYSFAMSILNIPYNLIGNSIGTIFLQKASEAANQQEDIGKLVSRLHTYLFALGVGPFAMLAVFGDLLFGLVFSEKWTMAGEYAGIMSMYFLYMIISVPLNSVYRIMGKENVSLKINFGFLILRTLSLLIAIQWFSQQVAIYVLSVTSIVGYMVNTAVIFRICNVSFVRPFIRDLSILVLLLVFLGFIRFVLFT